MNIYIEIENFYKEFPGKLLPGLNNVNDKYNVYIGIEVIYNLQL